MGQRKAGPSTFSRWPGRDSLDYVLAAMTRSNSPKRWHPPDLRRTRRPLRVVGLLAFAGVLGLATAASAATVRGRLEGFRLLQNPVWGEARDPKNRGYSFREPVPTVRAEFRRLYPHIPKELCVALLAATPQKASPLAVPIKVGGGRTSVVTVVVVPGTKLVFQNTDSFKHRLYAVGLKTFTANDMVANAKREWTVPEAGVFEIRDELAPSLRMWVVAEPRVAAIGHPTLKGDFAVSTDVPGEYTVQAYFAGKPIGPALPVKIEAGDVDLSKTPLRLIDERAAAKAAKDEAEPSAGAKKP